MKLSIPTTLFLILINAISALGLGQKEELCQGLHPGVKIYKYYWDKEQCVFFVAEIDRKSSNVHLQVCIALDKVLGKETVPSIAQRKSKDGKKVLVAINGGFGVLGDFGGLAGISHNLFVQDGELISGPIPEDVCFGVTRDGRFLMGYPRMEAAVIFNNRNIPIEAVNNRMRGDQRRDYNSILYTPRFNHSTHTNDRVYEAVMIGAQIPLIPKYQSDVVLTSMGKEGDREIPPNGFVLSVRPRIYDDLFSQLQEGQRGKIEIRLEPDEWNDVVQAIGGNYMLVEDGRLSKFMKETLLSDRSHKPGRRHDNIVISHEPRTALGFNDEKLFLIVVDGRQGGYSTGMTTYEVAQVLIELGAKQAMNLDGGASSTFYADGEVLNRPSGGDLRKVLNAVLIVNYPD
jgi:hypothetical protein